MRKICAITFTTLALSAVAAAQLPIQGNVFFGYSYVHGETFANSKSILATGGGVNMHGWEGSGEGKFLPWLGAVVDLDWHYGGRDTTSCSKVPCQTFRLNASRNTVLFGPRASFSYGKFRPFADFLLGIARQSDVGGGISNSDLTFSYALGGGGDYTLTRVVALRGQAHVVHSSFFGRGQNDFRLSAGLVFRF